MLWCIALALTGGVVPARALEVVLATGASAATGPGARIESAYLLSVRDLLPRRDGSAGRIGWEIAGSPATLLDRVSRGSLTAGAHVMPWRTVRLGAGGLVRRDGQVAATTSLRAGFELQSGIVLPLGPGAGLDLNARYACLSRTLRANPAPDRFAERYWTVTAGVAFDW